MSTASSDGKTTSVVDDGFFIIHKCLKYVKQTDTLCTLCLLVCSATKEHRNISYYDPLCALHYNIIYKLCYQSYLYLISQG